MGPVTDVPRLVDVTDVAVIGDHELRLTFEDGTIGDLAFDEREWRGVFEPLADPAYFAQVRVDPERGLSPGRTASTWLPSPSTPRRADGRPQQAERRSPPPARSASCATQLTFPRDEPIDEVTVDRRLACGAARRVPLALTARRKVDPEVLVQASVDVDRGAAFDVAPHEDDRDLILLWEGDDHPPVATKIDNAETLDLISLQVIVSRPASNPLQVIHRVLRVRPRLAPEGAKLTVGDCRRPDFEVRHRQ